MEYLPPEVKLDILSYLPVEELFPICSSSGEFYSLCSDPQLWKEKFQREHLPLPSSLPRTLQEWIKEYKRSLEAKLWSRVYLNQLQKHSLRLNLSKLPSLTFLHSLLLGTPQELFINKEGEDYSLLFLPETLYIFPLTSQQVEAFLYALIYNNPKEWGKAL